VESAFADAADAVSIMKRRRESDMVCNPLEEDVTDGGAANDRITGYLRTVRILTAV
jgi:hypothetical protein